MNRRELVQKIVLGGTVFMLVPSVLQSCTKDTAADPPINKGNGNIPFTKFDIDLSLAENLSLNSTGGSRIVQNILVINTGNGTFAALSSICTHEGCIVGYDSGSGNIKCPCHGSAFTTTGSIVNGPAAIPLQSYQVSKTGAILTIS
jgi:cytochrome b6-f complex iron-sulfur subunit